MLTNNFIPNLKIYSTILEKNYIENMNIIEYLNSTIISSFKNSQYLVIDFKFNNSELNYWLMFDIICKYYKDEILIKDYKESFTIIKFI